MKGEGDKPGLSVRIVAHEHRQHSREGTVPQFEHGRDAMGDPGNGEETPAELSRSLWLPAAYQPVAAMIGALR